MKKQQLSEEQIDKQVKKVMRSATVKDLLDKVTNAMEQKK